MRLGPRSGRTCRRCCCTLVIDSDEGGAAAAAAATQRPTRGRRRSRQRRVQLLPHHMQSAAAATWCRRGAHGWPGLWRPPLRFRHEWPVRQRGVDASRCHLARHLAGASGAGPGLGAAGRRGEASGQPLWPRGHNGRPAASVNAPIFACTVRRPRHGDGCGVPSQLTCPCYPDGGRSRVVGDNSTVELARSPSSSYMDEKKHERLCAPSGNRTRVSCVASTYSTTRPKVLMRS